MTWILVPIVYLACAVALASSRVPWYDEGQDANPSYDWIVRGTTGISVLEPSGMPVASREQLDLPGIRSHNYTEMPLYLALLTGWFRVFGFGLITLRLFTVFAGLALLLAWMYVLRRLTGDHVIAAVSGVLLAIDYGYLLRTSEGRMDALSAAFGFGGLAVYLALREKHLSLAILCSHCCTAASAFTHPNGGFLAFSGILLLTLTLDRSRLKVSHVPIALLPYVLGVSGWAVYILHDVSGFRSQFAANARFGGRLQTFGAPLGNLLRELRLRYLFSLGGWGADSSRLQRLKILIPAFYAAGIAGVAIIRPLRKERGYRVLLGLAATYFAVLAFTDGRKSQCYLVHVIPIYVALLASWLVWLWRRRSMARTITTSIVTILAIVNLGGLAYQVREDQYHRSYLPVIRYLQKAEDSRRLIMGVGYLGIGLRYPDNLIDDVRLGMRSGKEPEFIVLDPWYRDQFQDMKVNEPDAFRFVSGRLQQYLPVYTNAMFTVMQLASTQAGSSAAPGLPAGREVRLPVWRAFLLLTRGSLSAFARLKPVPNTFEAHS